MFFVPMSSTLQPEGHLTVSACVCVLKGTLERPAGHMHFCCPPSYCPATENTENTSDLTFWWNSTHKNLCRPCWPWLTELKTNIYLYPKFWFSLWGQLFRAESIYIYGNYFELVMELALSSPL